MADTIKLPGMKTPQNKYVVYGIGAVLGYVAYKWWTGRSSASSTSAAGTSSGTGTGDPFPWDGTVGNPEDPYSQDPNTGMTYGDEGQAAGNYGGGGSGGSGGGGGGTGSNGPPFSTNAQWDAWALQELQSINPQLNIGDLTSALGAYLAGQPVDAAQKTLILNAEGIAGPPPVAGPNNYPPNIRLNGSKGGGGASNPVTGLRQTGTEGVTGADIAWNASSGATSYTVTSDKGQVEMTGATSARIRNIAPAHSQATVSVLANPAAAGAAPAKVVVHVSGKGS